MMKSLRVKNIIANGLKDKGIKYSSEDNVLRDYGL